MWQVFFLIERLTFSERHLESTDRVGDNGHMSNSMHFSRNMPEVGLQEAIIACGRIAYERRPLTANDGNNSVRLDDTLLLRQHGSLTVEVDLETALTHLERLEHVAEVFWRAHRLGKVERIPEQDKQRLAQLRQKFRSGG